MALQNAKKIFKDALENHYGVGAFNFVNYETLASILNTAEKNNSPVIIQSSVGAIKYTGLPVLKAMVYSLTKDMTVPVVWNLDHGKTFEDCKNAVDAGMTNVMIDASDKSFEDNIALTKQVVEYAHKHGVTVEAELGTLSGIEDEVNVSAKDASYTNPLQAKEFVERTGVDSLAIAIGTSHGAYKFTGDSTLRFDILEKIQQQLPNFPLVLHGASSIPQHLVEKANNHGAKLGKAKGVDEELLQHAVKENICKINVDSDLRIAMLAGIRSHFDKHPENIDLRAYLKEGMSLISTLIEDKMNNVFHSADKA